ncbi:hypothetical protein BXP70_22235 [Hymenobacter crusticola]|uniref:O-antigen polymerase n=1 Tax=Hymenobacter crusticola TaxID=1770526 RepID=A0A243WAH5_9BACT|nr:hypothetical protein BXP70_22235 [Hymenobacter crusticola]
MAADPNRLLKKGIWAYFLLLIFEGALRKWFLPGLASPLLLVRDPIAVWLIVMTWRRGLLPANPYLSGIVVVGVLGVFTAVFFGHGSLPVALYGARILLFHFPLMFVIGRLFDQEDVIRMGKALLWIAVPMTVLIALQFYSPQSAWVNRGVGGNMEGAGFSGSGDYFRPPGTFAFTNGLTLFYSLLAPFVLYFWLNQRGINRLLLLTATVALLAAIPLSISRGLFFQVGTTLIFTVLAIARKPKYLGKMLAASIGTVVVLLILSKTSFFQTATEAFLARFETGSEHEGGLQGTLGNRYLGGLLQPIYEAFQQPFFGHGIGMGTNVANSLLGMGDGSLYSVIPEGEWGRLVGELGPLMGLTVIFIRLGLSLKIALASYHRLALNDLLPWLLLSAGLLAVPQAQWAQPTSLGFSTLIGGLMLAALRSPAPESRNYQQLTLATNS